MFIARTLEEKDNDTILIIHVVKNKINENIIEPLKVFDNDEEE